MAGSTVPHCSRAFATASAPKPMLRSIATTSFSDAAGSTAGAAATDTVVSLVAVTDVAVAAAAVAVANAACSSTQVVAALGTGAGRDVDDDGGSPGTTCNSDDVEASVTGGNRV